MDPCLVYADASDGRLLGAYRPPSEWHQLSIRHLVVTPDDKVLIAMQHQGRADQRPPLVAMHAGEANLRMLTAPPAVQHRMRNYCGSVCTDSGGRRFAVSSPRGNLVTFWSTEGGGFLGSIDVADGCGLAPDTIDGRIVITSGTGDVLRHQVRGGIDRPLELPANLAARWDNHVTLCPAPKARGVDGRSALSGHGRRRDPVVQRG